MLLQAGYVADLTPEFVSDRLMFPDKNMSKLIDEKLMCNGELEFSKDVFKIIFEICFLKTT